MTVQPISSDDLIVWPDGTQCYRENLPEYSYMSDDYLIYPVNSPEWQLLTLEAA